MSFQTPHMPALRRTPLYDAHVEAGAKIVPFAGFEMPVQYTGIREEHLAVRNAVGVFDVSHMGQVETRGPEAFQAVQRLVSNDVRRIVQGGAQYSLLCREDGGVLDDLFTYRLGECHYLTVTNASNHERDLRWMRAHTPDLDVDLNDRIDDFVMLAVQGPKARALVGELADGPLPPRMHCCERVVAGAAMLVCGTGYTGEDGVELLLDPRTPGPSGTRCWRTVPRPPVSGHVTHCGSRRASTSTATTSARMAIRSVPDSVGRARRKRGSSAPRRWPR